MSFEEDIFDISRLDLQGSFEEQASELLSAVRLTRQEVEDLQQLLNDLQGTFGKMWPGCIVHPFGSIITGLGIRGSDVDCYVDLPPGVRIDNKIVYRAKACLSAHPWVFSELFAIPMAKVPIVKFLHIPTNTYGDVNFKSPSGVQNSKLVAYLLQANPKAMPLAVLIKYWSKVHKLTGTNLMPSYALTLLVIFFLQVRGHLPSVHTLQASIHRFMVDNWNTAFQELNYTPKAKPEPLFKLLGEFFVYYSNFDFKNSVICPFLGRAVPTECFIGVSHTPQEFYIYKDNFVQGRCRQLNINSQMCVQDPFEHCRNCAVAVFPRLAQKIFKLFKAGAEYYRKGESEFLVNIMTVHDSEEEVKPQPPPSQLNGQNQAHGVHKRNKETALARKKGRNHFMTMFNQFKNARRS